MEILQTYGKLCLESDGQKGFLRVMRLSQIPTTPQCGDEELIPREASECETEGGFCEKSHVRTDTSRDGAALVLFLKDGIWWTESKFLGIAGSGAGPLPWHLGHLSMTPQPYHTDDWDVLINLNIRKAQTVALSLSAQSWWHVWLSHYHVKWDHNVPTMEVKLVPDLLGLVPGCGCIPDMPSWAACLGW